MKYRSSSALQIVLVVALLAIIGYLGTVLWQVKHVLPFYYSYQYAGILNKERFAVDSKEFMAEVGGRTAALWEVIPIINRRQSLVFESVNFGRLPGLEGIKAPFFVNKIDESIFAMKLLQNETYCGNLITDSVVGVTLKQYGVIHLCRAPIITSEGLLVGYVSIGFRDVLEGKRRADVEKKLAAFAATFLH